MTLTNLVRRALRTRGYVEDDASSSGAVHVSIWAHGEQTACSMESGWLFGSVRDALVDEAIEAFGASVMLNGYAVDLVEEADLVRVSGAELEVTDALDTAREILHDWTDGGDSAAFDTSLMEASLAYALLDMHEPTGELPEHELLRFARDPELAAEARGAVPQSAEDARNSPPAAPGAWRRFRHPDGRRWAVRTRADGYDLEMTDEEGDVFTRSREQANASAEVALLIVEQLRAGFVDDAE